jgi:hypothetical protein
MAEATPKENYPPQLRKTATGDIDVNSLADLLEWFLNFDQRVGIVRLPQVEELYQWKQADDTAHEIEIYPFENAEARFAVGAFQALAENPTEEKLARWITDVCRLSATRNRRTKTLRRITNSTPANRTSKKRTKSRPTPNAGFF